MKTVIYNSKGEPIVLNALEQQRCNHMQKIVNDFGYDIDITTLTTIVKKVSEQKFFEIAPADYVPIKVGEGAWSDLLTTYRSFDLADDFSTGIINTGGNSSRMATGDAGVDSITAKVRNWAKEITWTIFDLQQAAKSGNWDLVTAKEVSRKKNWDLGIQKVAFLGLSDGTAQGLLNMSGISSNTAVITKSISSMTDTEFNTLCATTMNAYRSNCNRTAMPSKFSIPESDYLGLASATSASFPLISKLEYLQKVFVTISGKKDFEILPCAYADVAYSGLSVQRYALYNYEDTSLRMDIPVDYTNTLANSLNNFSFQNAAYGQFTGLVPYRPAETLYFDYTP